MLLLLWVCLKPLCDVILCDVILCDGILCDVILFRVVRRFSYSNAQGKLIAAAESEKLKVQMNAVYFKAWLPFMQFAV